jgi:hypothetical protein
MKKTKTFLRVSITLLALCGLVFAACSSGSDDDGSAPLSAPFTAISNAQVYDDAGTSTVASTVTFTQYRNIFDSIFGKGSDGTLTTAGMNNIQVTSGKLNIAALGTPGNSYLDNYSEVSGLTVTPTGAKCLLIKRFMDGSGNEVSRRNADSRAVLAYAPVATLIQGSAQGDEGSVSVNLNLRQGWSWVILKETSDSATFTSRAPGGDYIWRMGD